MCKSEDLTITVTETLTDDVGVSSLNSSDAVIGSAGNLSLRCGIWCQIADVAVKKCCQQLDEIWIIFTHTLAPLL